MNQRWIDDRWFAATSRSILGRTMDRMQQTMAAEERRLRRIAEVEERVLLSAVFELVEEVLPPTK